MSLTEIQNSPLLWGSCMLGVGLVMVQSLVFAYRSWNISGFIGITKAQLKTAVRASALASVGPSVTICVGLISLLIYMGGAVSWFRLAYIGSISYELVGAQFGSEAMGVPLTADMAPEVFSNCLWTMSLGCLTYLIFTALAAHKMDAIQLKMAGGHSSLIPVVTAGCSCGMFAYLAGNQIATMHIDVIAAVITGFVVMYSLTCFNKKRNWKWLREWGFTIAMFLGMAVSVMFM